MKRPKSSVEANVLIGNPIPHGEAWDRKEAVRITIFVILAKYRHNEALEIGLGWTNLLILFPENPIKMAP
jgi:hypothetical protein